MERFLIVVVVIIAVILLSIVLRTYQEISEPFVLTATRKPRTRNTTGRYSDEEGQGSGFFHCKRDDDTSEENASLPTCTEMRRGMIQKARDDGQIPEIPASLHTKYPPTDANEVVGSIGNLQVILNRTAKPSRRKMCVPFVDCDRYVNPSTKRLYCPVGMPHTTDSKGETTGCASFPENNLLHCEVGATNGSGRVSCSVFRNIQTVGPGFKLYPPQSIIQSALDAQTRQETEAGFQKQRSISNIKLEDVMLRNASQSAKTTADKIVHEKAGLVLNMIRSYPNIVSHAEKEAGLDNENDTLASTQGLESEMSALTQRHVSVLSQFFNGVMESYVFYQPLPGGHARVGFIRVPGLTPDVADLRAFDGEGPNYEVLVSDFIPDTLSPPSGKMPVMTPHKQTNYRLPRPSNPYNVSQTRRGGNNRSNGGRRGGGGGGNDTFCFSLF